MRGIAPNSSRPSGLYTLKYSVMMDVSSVGSEAQANWAGPVVFMPACRMVCMRVLYLEDHG